MKAVIDEKIPYLRDALEAMGVEVVALPGGAIGKCDLVDAQALFVRTRTRCDEALLADTPVRFIGTATIGYEHIDAAFCEKNGIEPREHGLAYAGSAEEADLTALGEGDEKVHDLDAAFLGEGGVQGDVRHAELQALDVVDGGNGLLGVEVTEAEGEHVQAAQAGLFNEAVGEQVEHATVDGAAGMGVAVIHHGGFHHSHGGMESGNLGTGGAHFDGAAAVVGDVLVFLTEGRVGVHLDLVETVGLLFEKFAELLHAEGFGFLVGLHAGNLDDLGGLGFTDESGSAEHQTESHGKSNDAFHKSSSELVQHALRHNYWRLSPKVAGSRAAESTRLCTYVFAVL